MKLWGGILGLSLLAGLAVAQTITAPPAPAPYTSAVVPSLQITLSGQSVAGAGPGKGSGAILRIRRGSKVGTCKMTIAAGNTLNQEVTIIDNIPSGTGC